MADSGEKVLYFLIGSFVGASVALLFAPRSGEETRRVLSDKYRTGTEEVARKVETGKQKVVEVGRDLKQTVESTVDKGRELVEEQKERIAAAVEAGKRAFQEEKSKLGQESGQSG
ncbi:MAG TPA: YtxH domain-containing protein [Acidobacteriota bacterium]|jgi:gas vesicle protein|nr:YtxH domain-containing protein [Acidobacteriota bacterium]HRR26949.1 YtxH domain-containing protein [Acidobacteriota bacterium]HRR57809.1 YtxH domain-containing protein [Acidobacteriota bacterium]HRV07157.1 YtxH domain-containing protein [Acidobacteriota bacterium]